MHTCRSNSTQSNLSYRARCSRTRSSSHSLASPAALQNALKRIHIECPSTPNHGAMDPSSPTQIKRSHSISECEVIIPRTRRSARALPAPEALEVIVTIVCDGRDSVLHNIKPSLTLANLLSSWCTDQVLDIEDMDFRCGGDYITSTDCDVLEKV